MEATVKARRCVGSAQQSVLLRWPECFVKSWEKADEFRQGTGCTQARLPDAGGQDEENAGRYVAGAGPESGRDRSRVDQRYEGFCRGDGPPVAFGGNVRRGIRIFS